MRVLHVMEVWACDVLYKQEDWSDELYRLACIRTEVQICGAVYTQTRRAKCDSKKPN